MVDKVELPFSKHAGKRYCRVKVWIDSNIFNGNVRDHVLAFRDIVSVKLEREQSPRECQKYLEEKITFDLHLVQLHGATDGNKRFEILESMKETETRNLDRTSLDLTYHSKQAVTLAKIGQKKEALEHIRQTMTMCDRCKPCFATVMALNDVMYAYQELCFVERTSDLLKMSLNHGQLLYHLLCSEDEEKINHWKRIILLFMVMTCLNISHEFEMGDIDQVSAVDIQYAEALIDEVKKVSKDIEIRRKMVLNLCQARLYEKSDRELAETYLKVACNLSVDGCIRNTEKINIEKYYSIYSPDTEG